MTHGHLISNGEPLKVFEEGNVMVLSYSRKKPLAAEDWVENSEQLSLAGWMRRTGRVLRGRGPCALGSL